MTITVKCKLDLTGGQREAIDKTMDAFAGGCNDALDVGREAEVIGDLRGSKVDIAHLRASSGREI